jgi:hypothetical protein
LNTDNLKIEAWLGKESLAKNDEPQIESAPKQHLKRETRQEGGIMNTEFLCIIPVDPKYVPTADGRESALAAFTKMLPMADSVDAIEHKEIRFIDAGMKFELVLCPFCDSELDQIWWGDAMSTAQRSAFENLAVRLPCCDLPSTLNNLNYKMPSGFARFLLQAREPKLGRYLTVDGLQTLESILDTPLKQIWAQHRNREHDQARKYRSEAHVAGSGRR